MAAGVLSVVAAFAYTCGLALQQKANLDTPYSHAGFVATVRRVVKNRRPFRSWAAVHLRALREERTHEIRGSS